MSAAAGGPRVYDRHRHDDERAFVLLREREPRLEVHDTVAQQVAELVRCRRPADDAPAREAAAREALGPHPERYGSWVHYPWSGRLVHVLPEREHAELRTSRNRNKITAAEQARLGALTIGVVGLSVGQATALTLALEGIGGELRLADHDTLSLSNLNRLRAGVHEIGVNKAVITARAIWEINPYARLSLFTEGVHEGVIDDFLDGLDLLFEECDDLAMKVRLREGARARRIPVLMETSDRGMLDVERFDLEPERPLLHGLVGDLDARSLRGLSTAEKVPIVLALIGDISARGAASLVDVDTTLETWPQLASAVSLGAAINADCARRIALGTFRESGRFYVDLEQLVGGVDAPPEEPAPAPPPAPLDARPVEAPQVREIVRWASLAPSGGNCQPWRFRFDAGAGALECWHDRARSESMLDFDDRASWLALGAALENARLACVRMGLGAEVARAPGPPGLAWRMRLGAHDTPRAAQDDALTRAVEGRSTNRRLGVRLPLPSGAAQSLAQVAADAGGELVLRTDPETIAEIGALVARSEKLRMLHPRLHREMVHELRWTSEEAARTGDGIDVSTLELGAADAAGLRLLRSSAVVRTLRAVGGGEGLKKPVRRAAEGASAFGLVRAAGDPRAHATYLRGGEASERVWLMAEASGVAVQPMTAILFLLMRAEEGGDGLDADERAELASLREGLDAIFGPRRGADIMLLRFAVVASPTVRALRRPLEQILSGS